MQLPFIDLKMLQNMVRGSIAFDSANVVENISETHANEFSDAR